MGYSIRFKLQRRFFEDVQIKQAPVAQLLHDLGVSYEEFEKWLAQPSFQARWKRARSVLGHVRELDLDRSASFSAGKIAANAFRPDQKFLSGDGMTHTSNIKLRASAVERKKHSSSSRHPEPSEKPAAHPEAPNPEEIVQRMEERN